MMTDEDIRKAWLVGTTCALKRKDTREVLFSNEIHIVLKHHSHADYTGRSSGSVTCPSFARLYVKSELISDMKHGSYCGLQFKQIKEWTGRISRSRVKEECAQLGIVFQ